MKRHFTFLCLMVCLAYSANSQSLPRGLSESEKQMMAEGFVRPAVNIPGDVQSSFSPGDQPRAVAEWEEMQGIVISWTAFPSILKEIVRHASKEVNVIILTLNETSVRTYLENNDVDISNNVEFLPVDFNTIWIRDYGPNSIYLRDVDSLAIVDWIYNRPRFKDDVTPYAIAEHLDLTIYGTEEAPFDLVNTGGNFMSDGLGRGFSSNLVLDENGPDNNFGTSNHDEQAVNDIMQQFMGIDEYVKMTVLPYDAIHHIDMHMKLVDEGTLIVGEYPESVADGPQIEANLQYVVDQFKRATGRDYRVVRVPMPPDDSGLYPDNGADYRTYANAMFINKTILVPTYEEQYDTTALRIWRETMPGYKVIGINCDEMIYQSGALHCIIKEVAAHRPLWITHHQPEEILETDAFTLDAQIKHIDGIETARVFYRIQGAVEYDSLDMQLLAGDLWTVTLPHPDETAEIEYYFKAIANDGKTITRPLPAPEGFFRVHVESLPTGTKDQKSEMSSLNVFPNPAGAITCIPLTIGSTQRGTLGLYDLHGKLVHHIYSGTFPQGESKYFFDAAQQMAGYYLVRLETEQNQMVVPVVVK